MSCEICGSGACTRSFHSLVEQDKFDDGASRVEDRVLETAITQLNQLDYEHIANVVYIRLDEAIAVMEGI